MRFPILCLWLCLWLCLLISRVAHAQPSDAQVLKDIRSPRQKSIKLRPGHGDVTWDPERRVHLYARQFDAVLPSELPGVDVIVFAQAVYQRVGGGPWTYWRDETFENRYSGIPNPSLAEVRALVDKVGLPHILQGYFHRIVGDIQPFELAAAPKWEWHTPNSVSVNLVTEYRIKESNTRLEHVRETFRVRMYRDALKGPWLRAMAVRDNAAHQLLSTEEKDKDELAAMKTVATVEAEAAARGPTVELPRFADARAVVDYTYQMLRTADEAGWRAYHRAMLPKNPYNFQAGSDVLLTPLAQRSVDQIVENVIKHQLRFRSEFCPKLKPREPIRERPGATQVYFVPKGGPTFCRMVVDAKLALSDIECRVPGGPAGDQLAAIDDAQACPP